MQERVKVRSKDARNVLIQMLKPYRNGQMQGVYPSGCKHVVLIWGQAKDSGGTHEGNRRAYNKCTQYICEFDQMHSFAFFTLPEAALEIHRSTSATSINQCEKLSASALSFNRR
jgi:hypothetical protein